MNAVKMALEATSKEMFLFVLLQLSRFDLGDSRARLYAHGCLWKWHNNWTHVHVGTAFIQSLLCHQKCTYWKVGKLESTWFRVTTYITHVFWFWWWHSRCSITYLKISCLIIFNFFMYNFLLTGWLGYSARKNLNDQQKCQKLPVNLFMDLWVLCSIVTLGRSLTLPSLCTSVQVRTLPTLWCNTNSCYNNGFASQRSAREQNISPSSLPVWIWQNLCVSKTWVRWSAI